MRRTLYLLVLLLGCADSTPPEVQPAPPLPRPASYDITVDGEAPDLEAHELIEGRVVWLGHFRIALGPPTVYRFRTGREQLLQQQESGEWRCVAVKVASVKQEDKYVLHNPLAEMSEGEIRQLLAVEIHEPVEGIEAKLAAIDSRRCVVRLWISELDDWKRFPKLPAGLRHLSLWLGHEEGSEYGHPVPDLSPMRELTGLRWFQLWADQMRFDLGLLAGCRDLEVLEIPDVQVLRAEALGAFERLRELQM